MAGMSAKSRAAAVSVLSNACLVALKLAVGVLSGSVSVVSEAIHSANDLLAAAIAWFSVRTSDKKPDPEHQYGHGKVEGISGAVEAALIVVAAVWIIVQAVLKIRHGGEIEHLGAGAAVMIVSTVVNIFVSRHLFRVARQEDSLALEADAHHLSTDVYTSLGVAVGLGVVLTWRTITGGSKALDIVDPIVAIGVALFILKIGIDLTKNAVGHLLDRRLPDEDLAVIHGILDGQERLIGWHDLRSRKSGSQRYVDVHVTMRADATLAEAHEVAEAVETAIAQALPGAQAVVHMEPPEPPAPGRRDEVGPANAGRAHG